MLPCLCGSFHHQQEDDDVYEFWTSSVSTPRKSKRNKDSKNPYSTRGLDKFSALLAELDEKRQQIYSQIGAQGIVRFVYKNSNDCVPVIVKLKDKKEEKNKPAANNGKDHHVSEGNDKLPIIPSESDNNIENKKEGKKMKKKSFSWNAKLQNLRRPSYYIPAVIILILLLLVFFGRSIAILCTCIGWYLVPTISGGSSNHLRTSMKKKDYERKLSRNKHVSGKLSSVKSNNSGTITTA